MEKTTFSSLMGHNANAAMDRNPEKSLTKKVATDGTCQTEVIKYIENGTDPMVQPSKQTQTQKDEERIVSARQIRLSEHVVDTVVEQLQQIGKEKQLFEELDGYHDDKMVHLEVVKTFKVEMLEDIPFHSIKCSHDKRLCVLYGERLHDNWCLHSGRLLLWEPTKTTWIALDSCPSQVVFGTQKQVVVGTATGTVNVIVGDEVVWTSDQMHIQAITSLKFISPKLILSTAMDGRLVVLNLQAAGLEVIKSAPVNVSDLPRSMRRSNSSAMKVSAVDSTLDRFQSFVATETGAILLVDPENLTTTPVGYDPDGIDVFDWANDKFVVVSSADGGVKLLDRNGQIIDRLDCRVEGSQYCRNGNIYVFLGRDSVVGYDISTSRKLFDQNANLIGVSFDSEGHLVGMNQENVITWFELDYSN
ncbi:unnamed protein product [Bursaphelenchus okinawaensis]|uniref:WD_REPEATS_REGION domain-containing protein n=1 Tax=Bursaphelenchus okinawaensis TaxID=465554 RepID=A0A811JSE0_9BILA|nr:unnamed protein product [Bursaphelenchus okinawaensis]CAG9081461.1 unnamed protein product [Bursaphelenchus okinawaensis]